MAEGGEEDNDNNSFSFNKLNRRGSRNNSSGGEGSGEDDHPLRIDLLDGSDANDRREEDRRTRDTDRDLNPFSFKRFLQSNAKPTNTGPTSLKTLDLANDLPDFVQNHYPVSTESGSSRHVNSGSSSITRHHAIQVEPQRVPSVPLPDFALDSAMGSGHPLENSIQNYHLPSTNNGAFSLENSVSNIALNFKSGGPRLPSDPVGVRRLSGVNLGFHDSSDSDSDSDNRGHICQANSAGGLPDFLPDSAISGAGARPKVIENGVVHLEADNRTDQDNRIHQLQVENAALRTQLAEAQEETRRTQERLDAVLSSHVSQQAKEAEETAVLESVVQQVETNLQAATKRASNAESTVNRLRKELKQLNIKYDCLEQENAVLRQGAQDPLRDKTRYAAEQLSAAAKSAERHLKQLMLGVETLKIVSESLLSAEKLTDIEQDPPDFGCTRHEESKGAEGGT